MGAFIGGGGGRDQVARLGLVLNSFDDLMNSGAAVQRYPNAIVDAFEDQAGIGTATNASYAAAPGCYAPTSVTNMISQTLGSLNSNAGAGIGAAFDGTLSQDKTYCERLGGSDALYVGRNYGAGAKQTCAYALVYPPSNGTGFHDTGNLTVTLTLAGYNGTSWVNLGTWSGANGSVGTSPKTIVSSDTVTLWEQLRVTMAAVADLKYFAEVQFYSAPDVVNPMTLVSVAASAAAASRAMMVLLVEPVDAITLNTDFKAHVSDDNGGAWHQVVLSDMGDHGSGVKVLLGEVGLTGGANIKWKVESFNSKRMNVHAVGVMWDGA